VNDGTVHTERTRASGRVSERRHDACESHVVADAGLLQYLRLFPFEESQHRDVLIASFTQHFVTMQLALEGREAVSVPAGQFDCYRLVGTIDLFVKKIRTVYWITVEDPHFLVRFEGKRGLFLSPTYVTELTSLTVGNLGPADGEAEASTDDSAEGGHNTP
jgi:hypothetical protein